MPNSLIQIRVDDKLKSEATNIYEELGIDLPTAVRIFLKRSVIENGIPFSMKLPDSGKRFISYVDKMNEISEQNGTSDMLLDEINEEISMARKGETID